MGGVSRSGDQIHLPQTLSEERSRDELSDWEQVSWAPAECIVHRQSPPPPVSAMLPRPLIPTHIRHASPSAYLSPLTKKEQKPTSVSPALKLTYHFISFREIPL